MPPQFTPEACPHKFGFQGTVYWSGNTIPGSEAKERVYADRYFCKLCLYISTINLRTIGNTYGKPLPNTLPR